MAAQILSGAEGEIHYSYYLPEGYDTEKAYPMVVVMPEHDEYYGSQKARDAYEELYGAYRETGLSDEEIDGLLQLEIPGDEYFHAMGIYNYHGGGTGDPYPVIWPKAIINWRTSFAGFFE